MIRNKLVVSVLGGAVALGLLGSAAVTFAQSGTTAPSTAASCAHRGGMGDMMRGAGDQGQALADALGITLERAADRANGRSRRHD